jgi:voltage-gated potassium channel
VSAFLEVVRSGTSPDFRFEEIEVTPGSHAAGRSIKELQIGEQTGALIVAHKRFDQGFNTRPDPDLRLEPGDVLIGVGTPDEIRSFEELFGPREAVV